MKGIGVLPDDILLEIFDFYVDICSRYEDKMGIEAWQSLVHVSRRWRSLVFQSSRRLNLRLYCTPATPATDTLVIWPALPLIVHGSLPRSSGADNLIAALGQRNRVCHIQLWSLLDWQLEKVLAAMEGPYPELTEMWLWTQGEISLVIPDSFLDGSAPRLQILLLDGISFPGLPKLLPSATQLVRLSLLNVPHSGYISPEPMVVLLSVLPSLRILGLDFQSPQSRPDLHGPNPSPPKLAILPALHEFHFKGTTEYLEQLVTGIDTPQVREVIIIFFNQIDFDIPRLSRFINRTPTLKALDEAHVQFDGNAASLKLQYQTSKKFKSGVCDLLIEISCKEQDWQLSSVEQVCNSLPSISIVEDLYIEPVPRSGKLVWKNDAEDTSWLQLLLPFAAVKNLYLSKEFARGIAATLKELVQGRITLVLRPSLENIFLEGLEPSGPLQDSIKQFVTARQLSGHPVAISAWDKYSNAQPK